MYYEVARFVHVRVISLISTVLEFIHVGGAGVVAEGNDGDAIFGSVLKMPTTLTKVGLSLMHTCVHVLKVPF